MIGNLLEHDEDGRASLEEPAMPDVFSPDLLLSHHSSATLCVCPHLLRATIARPHSCITCYAVLIARACARQPRTEYPGRNGSGAWPSIAAHVQSTTV